MQYAIENGKVFVLEANPRASRTVPLVSKVCNIRMVPLATDIITSEITGRPSPILGLKEQVIPNYGVKEARGGSDTGPGNAFYRRGTWFIRVLWGGFL